MLWLQRRSRQDREMVVQIDDVRTAGDHLRQRGVALKWLDTDCAARHFDKQPAIAAANQRVSADVIAVITCSAAAFLREYLSRCRVKRDAVRAQMNISQRDQSR